MDNQNPTQDSQQIPQTPSTSQSIQDSSTSSMKLKKNITLIFVIGALLLLMFTGGSYYLFFSSNKVKLYTYVISPTPTAKNSSIPLVNSTTPLPTQNPIIVNWSNYTSKDNRYRFKYPSEAMVNSTIDGFPPTTEVWINNKPVISIGTYENSDNLSLSEVNKKYTRHTDVQGDENPELDSPTNQPINLNGTSAFIQNNFMCEPSVCTRYIVPLKGVIYTFLLFNGSVSSSEKETIDTIISTIRFIN